MKSMKIMAVVAFFVAAACIVIRSQNPAPKAVVATSQPETTKKEEPKAPQTVTFEVTGVKASFAP